VPGLYAQMWNASMHETYITIYESYYSSKHVQATLAKCASKHFDAAIQWIEQLQKKAWERTCSWCRVMKELRQREAEKVKKEGKGGQVMEQGKEEERGVQQVGNKEAVTQTTA